MSEAEHPKYEASVIHLTLLKMSVIVYKNCTYIHFLVAFKLFPCLVGFILK